MTADGFINAPPTPFLESSWRGDPPLIDKAIELLSLPTSTHLTPLVAGPNSYLTKYGVSSQIRPF